MTILAIVNQFGGLRLRCSLAMIMSTMRGSSSVYDAFLTKQVLKQEYVSLGKSMPTIGAQFGIDRNTIAVYLQRYGIARRSASENHRRYRRVDVRPFLELTSDQAAYWLGFLAADGCVYRWRNSLGFRLKLSSKDFQHLRRFRRLLRTDTPTPLRHGQGYSWVQIEIWDKQFTDALARWSIIPNKARNLTFPKQLPPSLIPAYIRGYFDGDGTVYRRRTFYKGTQRNETVCRFISSSTSFLTDLAIILNEHGIVTHKMYRNQKSNAFFLPLSGKRDNLRRFSDYLYAGSTCSLARKRTIFQEAAA